MEHAIDEFEEKDDSQWSNIKALQGAEWKGRLTSDPKTPTDSAQADSAQLDTTLAPAIA